MTNVDKCIHNSKAPDKKSGATCLDTLRLTSELFQSKTHESLYYRALRKYSTNAKLIQIVDLPNIEEQWKSKYWKTWHCYNVLLKVDNEIKGMRCKERWCQNCSRIKAADITNGYKEPLSKYESLYHVVLTRPNIKGRELRREVEKMIKSFQQIKDSMRKEKMVLNGFRKLECTHNAITEEFHPHFHILIEGKENAEKLLSYWLKKNRKARRNAQSITLVDNDNYMREVAKYAAKDPVKDEVSANAAHTMYKALAGKRIYQPFGNLKKVVIEETPEETTEEIQIKGLPKYGVFVYEQSTKDWTESNGLGLVNTLDLEIIINDIQIKQKNEGST